MAKHGPDVPYLFEHAQIRDLMSSALTILASLEHLGRLSRFSALHPSGKGRTLTVHVVGSTTYFDMIVSGRGYEEILHFLPGVTDLRIIFIGPEEKDSRAWMDIECCPACVAHGKSRYIMRYQ